MDNDSKSFLLWGLKILIERYSVKSLPIRKPEGWEELTNALLGKSALSGSSFHSPGPYYALESVFSRCSFANALHPGDEKYLHPNAKFGLAPSVFPDSTADLQPPWTFPLPADLDSLSELNAESLLNLLHQYGAWLPVHNEPACVFPLYDTIKLLAALSTSKERQYHLVIGDLSGIQDFIYTIDTKGALKTLRARSFYLELLTHSVAFDLCEDFQVSTANMLLACGGNFILILPMSSTSSDRLHTHYRTVNSFFIEHFEGRLHLPIVQTPFVLKDLPSFDIVWKELYRKLEEAKKQKFHDQIERLAEPVEPQGRECHICHADAGTIALNSENECDFCRILTSYSSRLTRLDYIHGRLAAGENDAIPVPSLLQDKSWYYTLDPKGAHRTIRFNTLEAEPNYLMLNADYAALLKSHPDQAAELADMENSATGAGLVGALVMDVDNMGAIFADGLRPDSGYPQTKLILTHTLSRNLNYFFKFVLKEICQEPQYRALAGIINFPDEEKHNPRNVSVIYSGGDDLLIIGAWNDLVELSIDLRLAFGKMSSNNPDLGLSGALYLFESHYPFYNAVKKAQAAEHLAKSNVLHFGEGLEQIGRYAEQAYAGSRIYDVGTRQLMIKDSITLFYDDLRHQEAILHAGDNTAGRYRLPITWEEMTNCLFSQSGENILKHLGQFLTPQLAVWNADERKVDFVFPRSFITKLYYMVDKYQHEDDESYYLPDLVYQVARFGKDLQARLQDIYKCYNMPYVKDKNYILFLPIILSWLELLLREKGELKNADL